jgi:hypothetical protein
MTGIYHGDEWKRERRPESAPETRAEIQSRLNADYAVGRITRDQWRAETDRLSEPEARPAP